MFLVIQVHPYKRPPPPVARLGVADTGRRQTLSVHTCMYLSLLPIYPGRTAGSTASLIRAPFGRERWRAYVSGTLIEVDAGSAGADPAHGGARLCAG